MCEIVDVVGWLYMGDFGCVDVNGNLKIIDCIKDMFIVGGFNCYLVEIEWLFVVYLVIV